jgi:NADPH:quinone reductase
MRVVVCEGFGPVENLVVREVDSEPPRPGQVRLRMRAAGLSFVDGLVVQGKYQLKPKLPFRPGGEALGTVVELGEGVDASLLGRRMLSASGMSGAWATEVVTAATQLLPVPDNLTDGQAATFLQSYLTGWFALRQRITVGHGEKMLVLGAGSGVGLAAKELSGGGVDLVYDPIGGPLAEPCLRALREEGRYLVIGFAAGAIPTFPINQVLLRNRSVIGVEYGGWAGRFPEENRALTQEVLDRLASEELRPIEPQLFPLDRVAEALSLLGNRGVTGKLALIP